WTPETAELWWSDNRFRLFGLEPDSVTATPVWVLGMTHTDDRERQSGAVELVRRGATYQPFDFRILRPNGTIRYMRSTVADTNGRGGLRRILGTVQDLTDQRRTESQIAGRLAATEALTGWDSLEQGGENLLRGLCEAMDCVAGGLWLPDGGELVARVFWRVADLQNAAAFEAATRTLRLARGEGLPGRLWQTGSAIVVSHVKRFPGYIRTVEADAAGLRGAMAFAAPSGADVAAVVELYSRSDAEPSDGMLRSLNGIGHELSHFLARRHGEDQQPLTVREREVLRAAALGNSRARIAAQLTVSPSTIKTHFEHIYEKLGVSGRAAAVAKAVREGVID
ncbi:MAG: PAS domain-containing protein, partial [Chloroflexi bacterium]|nr:PAS domain-containing protein [Chloroflexota bacterium]